MLVENATRINEMSEIPFEQRRFTYHDLQAAGYGSRATIWRRRRAGTFPEPISEGGTAKWTGAQLVELNKRSGEGGS